MPWEQEEVVAVATKLTEPLTVLLLAGELMYTPAKAGAQGSILSLTASLRVFRVRLVWLCEGGQLRLDRRPY